MYTDSYLHNPGLRNPSKDNRKTVKYSRALQYVNVWLRDTPGRYHTCDKIFPTCCYALLSIVEKKMALYKMELFIIVNDTAAKGTVLAYHMALLSITNNIVKHKK